MIKDTHILPHQNRQRSDLSINTDFCCQTGMSTNCFHFSNLVCGFRGGESDSGSAWKLSTQGSQNGNIFNSFELYRGLDGLYTVFSNEAFLLIFWLHFLAISLFMGAWIGRDSQKYMVSKFLVIVSLILTYFTGPLGLIIYWFIRIFFSKKISFND